MRIVCYQGRGPKNWRWRLVAANGRIIADSAEGYATRSNLVRAVKRLERVIPSLQFRATEWR